MLVGRSLVSAITQTPASGPFELRTTPPRSVSPMLTAGVCCAKTGPGEANAAAMAMAATPEYKAALFLISLSSNDFHQVSWLPPGTAWRSPGARHVKAAHGHAI